MSQHIHGEIEKLKRRVLSLSGVVESSLEKATAAVLRNDTDLADEVIAADEGVDEMEVEIEEECLKILALYQPVATDLRFVVAVLKLNNDLERVGDLAVNIAEQVQAVKTADPTVRPHVLPTMIDRVRDMFKQSLDALINLDADAARAVGAADDEVDDMHRGMFGYVVRAMKENPAHAEVLIHFLSISRYLERIADHATNIAEDVIYMTEGDIVRHTGAPEEDD
jgi:phosphate transport system protein